MSSRNTQYSFFWEKKTHPGRSRFNLLLLEYGEYFFEDLSVYLFPVPNERNGKPFHQCDALKVQGRMKLCSRSIIFEPTDQRKPIIKYLFKSFRSSVEEYFLSKQDRAHCTVELSGFFTFRCAGTIEMMENGKVGPYRIVDFANKVEGATILFASVHTQISSVIGKINQLYNMYQAVERDGVGLEFMSMLAIASTTSFDTSQLLDFHEGLLLPQSVSVKKIRPLIINPGCLMITDKRVYYQPAQLNNVGDPVEHYDFVKISRIYKRRYLLRHTSLELIMVDGTSAFFCFEDRTSRDEIYNLLIQTLVDGSTPNNSNNNNSNSNNNSNNNNNNNISTPTKISTTTFQRRGSLNLQRKSLESVVRQWQRREITNFEYLMYLNNEADRSMNDLTQYPVFPHVIQDYKSSILDLKNPQTFRDLSKPIGALNPSRLEHFKSRYNSMPNRDDSAGIPPPFLYGTHYSTPGYVLHFLVRIAPEYMLCLQTGKFDAPDRSFLSISESWDSCLNNPADLKELIPEFFIGNGDFLVNNDDLDLGHRHNGERLNDVDLPPWAKSSRDFIRKHAKALESEYVSNHLHEWIDLIFGYKQQGQEAIANDNVFYYLTYEGAVDLEKEPDPRRRRALEMQIQEFGQTPKQLFAKPHPMRGDHSAEIVLCNENSKLNSNSNSNNNNNSNSNSNSNNIDKISNKNINSSNSGNTSKKNDDVSKVGNEYKTPEIKKNNINNNSNDIPNISSLTLGDDFKTEVDRELKKVETEPISTTSTGTSGIGSSSSLNTSSGATETSSSTPSTPFSPSRHGSITSSSSGLVGSIFGAFSNQKLFGNNTTQTTNTPPTSSSLTTSTTSLSTTTTTTTATPPTNQDQTDNNSKSTNSKNTSSAINIESPVTRSSLIPTTTLNTIDTRRVKSLRLISPFFIAHSESVMGVYMTSGPSPMLCSCSKDSFLKVLQLEPTDTSAYQISVRRCFKPSDPNPVSACCVSKDGRIVFAACYDNIIYSYSILNACVVGRLQAHDDSVTSLAIDSSGKYLISGSCDASVKVWKISEETGELEGILELYEHESPVISVAINDSNTFIAAGAEDGSLVVWSTNLKTRQSQLAFSKLISTAARRPLTSVRWIPSTNTLLNSQIGFTTNKLICSSGDGLLVCLDSTGKLFAATKIQPSSDANSRSTFNQPVNSMISVNTLLIDQRGIIYCGCDDSTIRILFIEKGYLKELYVQYDLHHGVTTMTLNYEETMLVSSGEDGGINVWKLELE